MTAEVCGDVACCDTFGYELYDYESEISWNGRLVASIDELKSATFFLSLSEDVDKRRFNYFRQMAIHLALIGAQNLSAHEKKLLDCDIAELVDESDFVFADATYNRDFTYASAQEEKGVLCKSFWRHVRDKAKHAAHALKDAAHKAEKFVRHHEKEILLSAAAIAVVAATVGIAVAIAGSAAAGAAAASADNKDKKPEEPKAPPVPNQVPETIAVPPSTSLGEGLKEVGSGICHDVLNGINSLGSAAVKLRQETADLLVRLPNFDTPVTDVPEYFGKPLTSEGWREKVDQGHKNIDELFSTNRSSRYQAEDKFISGTLPPPLPGMAKIVEEEAKIAEAAAKAEIVAGESRSIIDGFANNPAMRESYELYEKAQNNLKIYREFMSEAQCRDLIHKTGIPTFPRPAGVPDSFRVRISDKGAGLIYMHPEHTHTSIRVMPGKPHSPFSYQQQPYVIYRKDGKTLDKFGNVVDPASPATHIPFEEFVYKD